MNDLIQITTRVVNYIHPDIPDKRKIINLLIGTAAAESKGRYLLQIRGPARSFWQIEPFTACDVWDRYCRKGSHQIPLPLISEVSGVYGFRDLADSKKEMEWALTVNIAFACVTARLVYMFKPEPLPAHNDIKGMAEYWKKHYNTHLGRGTVTHFMESWVTLVRPALA